MTPALTHSMICRQFIPQQLEGSGLSKKTLRLKEPCWQKKIEWIAGMVNSPISLTFFKYCFYALTPLKIQPYKNENDMTPSIF